MDNEVANRILFDFEIITFLALILGLGYFASRGSFSTEPKPGEIGSQFHALDLVMVSFPLMFFLSNPILIHLFREKISQVDLAKEKTFSEQLFASFEQFLLFGFIGIITVVMIKWVMSRDAKTILGLEELTTRKIMIMGAIGAFAGVIICSRWVGEFSNSFLTRNLGELDAQKAVQDFKKLSHPILLTFAIINACIVAPLVEETLFRGYFYGALKRFSHPIFATLITSALFAVVHLNLPALLPLWVLAILLTVAYELTKCLWVPIVMHALFNGFNIAVLFFSKSADETPAWIDRTLLGQ